MAPDLSSHGKADWPVATSPVKQLSRHHVPDLKLFPRRPGGWLPLDSDMDLDLAFSREKSANNTVNPAEKPIG